MTVDEAIAWFRRYKVEREEEHTPGETLRAEIERLRATSSELLIICHRLGRRSPTLSHCDVLEADGIASKVGVKCGWRQREREALEGGK